MAELLLKADTGRATGSRPAKRMRREGKVPGVVYGLGGESAVVSVDYRALRAVLSTEAGLNALFDLEVDGETQLSIVKELQRDPVRRDVVHVDFLRVDPEQEIAVDVPLVLSGEAKQVTDEDGTVEQLMFSVGILARPDAIPNELVADISELTIGSAVRVGDLVFPEGVRSDVDPEEPIAVGTVARVEVEEEVEADLELLEGEEGEVPADAEAEAADGGDESDSEG